MLQKNFSPFYFIKYFSENSRNAEDEDKKTWFKKKKFIYDSITWPDRQIALTTQLKICHCNDKKRDSQTLFMNIGADGWSINDVSRGGFHTRVFRKKRRIALWNTSESERVDDSSIACAYVYINGCARECASSIDRSAWILRTYISFKYFKTCYLLILRFSFSNNSVRFRFYPWPHNSYYWSTQQILL